MEWAGEAPAEFWWGAAGAAALVAGVWRLAVMVGRWREGARLRRRGRIASRAEVKAERVLRRAGYVPLEAQAEGEWEVLLDGEVERVRLYADWLAERDGLVYVVEVKTGRRAPSIRNAATRRQLLEYFCAFEVDGVLLLDMEEGLLQEVEFPGLYDREEA